MMRGSFIRGLRRDANGSMAIETAVVMPVLLLLSLGAFEVSNIVARQSELQTAVAEAAAIAQASQPDTAEKRTTLQQIMMVSTGLPAGQIAVTEAFRCNGGNLRTGNTCAVGDRVSSFVHIVLTDRYEPLWTTFGVGEAIDYNVSRYIMYKQGTKA